MAKPNRPLGVKYINKGFAPGRGRGNWALPPGILVILLVVSGDLPNLLSSKFWKYIFEYHLDCAS